MSPRDWTLRIEDMLQAIGRITQYVEGMTWETFSTDQKTMDAVVRNIEIIGEAARHVPEEIAARYPQIPWTAMRGMRNIFHHPRRSART